MNRRQVSRTHFALFSFFAAAAAALSAHSQVAPALDVLGLGTTGVDYYQNNSYCLGWRFTTNKDVIVTALGFYDDKKNGITGNHDVGIYDVVSHQLLATTQVVPSDPLIGFFRYHALSARVTLPKGKDYYIQCVSLTDRYANNAPDFKVDPAITFKGYAGDTGNVPSTTLHYPNGTLSSTYKGNFGPSLLIANPGDPNPNDAAAIDFAKRDTGSDVNQGSFCMGFRFRPTQDIVLKSLGYYDDKQDGLTQSHSVVIYDAITKNAVASTLVTNADPIKGFFRYHAVPPVTLQTGFDYFIMGDSGLDNYLRDEKSFTANPLIQMFGGAFTTQAPTLGAEFPTQTDTKPPFYGPNFEILSSAAPPLIVKLSTPQANILLGRTLNFTLLATGGKPGNPITYTIDFGDFAGTNGSLTVDTPTVLPHAYNVPAEYTVIATVTDGVSTVKVQLKIKLPVPNSGGLGTKNPNEKFDFSYTTKDGFKIEVTGSSGGVVELGIKNDGFVRAAAESPYSDTTTFYDVDGTSETDTGQNPVHLYTQHGIYIADVHVTNDFTGVEAGHGRLTVLVSKAETGEATTLTDPPGNAITATALSGKFNFSGAKADSVNFAGTIPLPGGIDPGVAHELYIAIGNIVVKANIDSKGKGTQATGPKILKSLKLSYGKLKKGTLSAGGETLGVKCSFSAANLVANGFDTEGIESSPADLVAPAKNVRRSIQVAMLLDGIPYVLKCPVDFTPSKDKKTGSIKGPPKIQ